MMIMYIVCMCTQVAYNTGVPVDMGSSSSLWMEQQGCEHGNIKKSLCYKMLCSASSGLVSAVMKPESLDYPCDGHSSLWSYLEEDNTYKQQHLQKKQNESANN